MKTYRRFREEPVLWGGAVALGLLAALAALFPTQIFDHFIWKYFWGPVVADAHGQATATFHGITAHSGYTLVNEIGYGILLVYLALLVIHGLKKLDIGSRRWFALSFTPFIILGGLLRVVEDASSAGVLTLPLPQLYLLISPLIYFTVFGVALISLLVSVAIKRKGFTETYQKPLAVIGASLSLPVLFLLSSTAPSIHAWVLAAVLGVAGVVFVPTVFLLHYPLQPTRLSHISETERLTVLFGYLLDGASTAVSLEMIAFNNYYEKHPLVEGFISLTGSAYSFLLLKLAVIMAVLYIMDEDLRKESPFQYNIILLMILAVGLGPATRNTFRAVLGI